AAELVDQLGDASGVGFVLGSRRRQRHGKAQTRAERDGHEKTASDHDLLLLQGELEERKQVRDARKTSAIRCGGCHRCLQAYRIGRAHGAPIRHLIFRRRASRSDWLAKKDKEARNRGICAIPEFLASSASIAHATLVTCR